MSSPSSKLTKDQVDEALEMYKNRVPLIEIGRKFGVSGNSIKFHVKKYGLLINLKEDIYNKDDIIKLYNENVPFEEIAKKYKVHRGTINQKLREWGVKLNGPERRIFTNRYHLSTEEIIKKVEELKNIDQVAAHFNVTDTTIRTFLRRANYKFTSYYRSIPQIMEENKEKIIELINIGDSCSSVSERLKIKKTTLFNHLKKWNIKYKSGWKNTSIELKVEEFLKQNNIDYVFQFSLGNYKFDFLIKDYNLIIECDGDYWHANPEFNYKLDFIQKKNLRRDKIKTELATRNNYKIIRFWEKDINERFNFVAESIIQEIAKIKSSS